MTLIAKYVGGRSSRYFLKQQITIARTEGFMEEMMNGQKVVKVFCHEKGVKEDFDKVNDELYENSEKANRYANILMPLLANVGNVMYVVVALVGGSLLLSGASNLRAHQHLGMEASPSRRYGNLYPPARRRALL